MFTITYSTSHWLDLDCIDEYHDDMLDIVVLAFGRTTKAVFRGRKLQYVLKPLQTTME